MIAAVRRLGASLHTHRRLGVYVAEYRKAIGGASLLTMLLVLTDLARPWPVKIIIDQVILGQPWPALPGFLAGDENRYLLLVTSAAAVLVLAVLGGALAYLRDVALATAGHGAVEKLRKDVYRRLLELPLSFHDRHSRGDLLVRLTGDATMMKILLVEGVFFLAQEILVVLGVIAVMCFVNLRLTLVAVLTIPTVALLVGHYGRRLKAAAQKQRRKEGEIAASVSEALAGIPMLQAYGLEDRSVEHVRRRNKRSRKAGLAAARLEASMSRATAIAIAVGTAALLLMGTRLVLDGAMTAGELIVLISYVRTLYKPLRRIAVRAAKIFKSAASGDRILELLDADAPTEPGAGRVLQACRGALEFRDVRYAYDDGRSALEGVDISIRPGEHVAICGPNGAGKSTLMTLIPRLREPTGGVIELDGVPLADLDLGGLRQQVAVVFQNPLLVDGTIEDNVLMAAGDSDDETIRWAMETAGVTEFAAPLEDGVLTTVGESGEALSGGQRQRIALARALARRPAVLILDEPTSAIDDVAARRLRERIPEAMRETTVLCVTHDAAWVEAMDRVIVMDRGTIVSDQSTEDWMADDRGSTLVGDTMLRESR